MLGFSLFAQFVIVDSLHLAGGYINGAAWDGSYVWIVNNDNDPGTKIHKVDPNTMAVLETQVYTYSLGGGFCGITYVPSNGHLYPTHYGYTEIWEVDPSAASVVNTYPAPTSDYPFGMAFDGTYIWYTDQSAQVLLKLSLPDMTPVGAPKSLSFIPKDAAWFNGHLYIMGDDDVLRVVDTADGSVLWSAPFPRTYCAGLAFGGGYMWVGTNAATGKLYKVSEPPAPVEEEPSPGLSLPEGTWDLVAYSVDGRKVWEARGIREIPPLPKLGLVYLVARNGARSVNLGPVLAR